MSKYKTWWYRVYHTVAEMIGAVNWTGLKAIFSSRGVGYDLRPEDQERIKELLASDYYLILINRKTHLSTLTIGFMTFVKTGKWPSYCHILMNLDLVDDPKAYEQFKLMEATNNGKGVHFSTFDQVFDCDSVCLLRPKNLDAKDWEAVMAGVMKQIGKPYDDLFNIKDDSRVSCVEMTLDALRESPNYAADFPYLEKMIKKVGNLTPQMFRDCADFEVKYEIKR